MSEFNLINQYFKTLTGKREDVMLGIGDDCALLRVASGKILATSTDTLISGVHFPSQRSAKDIAYKALAVNLSDLAAMGAQPAWVSLALTLPQQDELWLQDFCTGFEELARQYDVQLIGGDTTCGILSITVQIFGFVEPDKSLQRDKAQEGDLIYVSGDLGDAGLGLICVMQETLVNDSMRRCIDRLNRPSPRVELGLALALHEVCACAIDISDGLAADLQHITQASQCAADIYIEKIALSEDLKTYYANAIDWNQVLTSGDDYELCFTVNKSSQQKVEAIAKQLNIDLTCIGEIKVGNDVRFIKPDGGMLYLDRTGYNHFK